MFIQNCPPTRIKLSNLTITKDIINVQDVNISYLFKIIKQNTIYFLILKAYHQK